MFGIFSRKKREYSVYLPPKPKPIYELDIKVFNGKEVVHHRIFDVEEWNSLPNKCQVFYKTTDGTEGYIFSRDYIELSVRLQKYV